STFIFLLQLLWNCCLKRLASVVSRAHEYMPNPDHCKTAANKIER
ncbi:hypothetical protein ABID97_000001, partial [Variovorax sp. OAS795]